MNNKYNDPDWIAEKMFGEEFDSPIIYCLIDRDNKSVLCHGTFEKCSDVRYQFKKMGLTPNLEIVYYSELDPELKQLIPEPF